MAGMTRPDETSIRNLEDIAANLRRFAEDRDWDQFHSPKNLASALAVEAGEILEHFQWLGDGESARLPEVKLQEVALELADVLLYLVRLADKLDVDLLDAAARKMAINAEKYPAERVRGSSKKYTEL